MIEIVKDAIWIGNYDAEKWVTRHSPAFDAVLVVAHDMVPTNDWKTGLEYMHVGIVDGPGNPLAVYHAAVLALVGLMKRHKRVLVCDHVGSRALVVCIMYLYLLGDGPSWDEHLERLTKQHGKDMLPINTIHRKAFFTMDWSMMTRVLTSEVTDDTT